MTNFTIYILAFSNIICLVLGFCLASILSKNIVSSDNLGYSMLDNKTTRRKKEQAEVINKIQAIDIDDSKFVSNIDTSSLEKGFDKEITKSTEVNTDIQSSVNKLQSLMKGKNK